MTDHPSLDELAELAAGAPSDPDVAQHAADCADCTADLSALAAVSADLAALPAVAVPVDVAERIDAVLAAEARPATGATVVPLAARRPRRIPGWVSAAAVAVIAVGGSALLVAGGVFDGLSSKKASNSGADTASAPERGIVLTASGTNYTAKNLLTNLDGLLKGTHATSPPKAAAGAGGGSVPSGAPLGQAAPQPSARNALKDQQFAASITDLARLSDPTQLAQCLARSLGADFGTPLAVDLALYDGKPAVIAAYTPEGHPSQVDVYVLDPVCPEGTFRYWARLTPPSPS